MVRLAGLSREVVVGGDSRSAELILLYDGLCGLCNGTVRHILAHDRTGTMRFAPLQSPFAAQVLARHPGLAGVDSLVLVEQGQSAEERVLVRSEASLRIAEYLGGRYRAARLLRVLPRFLRDGAYALIARYRYRWFGRYDTCPIPPAEVRDRFIE